jgi:hypothetical protein
VKMLLDVTYVDVISGNFRLLSSRAICVYFWGVKHGQSFSLGAG